jgi:hypothetical protein
VTKVRGKINRFLLPSPRELVVPAKNRPGPAVVRGNEHAAGFEIEQFGTFGEVVAVPKAEGGFVAAGQFDGRTDKIGVGKFDDFAVNVAAPGVRRRHRLGLHSVSRQPKFPNRV